MSSSADKQTVRAQLHRAFKVLAAEIPAAHELLTRRLGDLRVSLQVDDERFAVAGAGGIQVLEAVTKPDVQVVTSRRTILDVLDGRCTVYAALLDGTLEAVGELDALHAAREALLAFVNGGVRAPGFPELLDRFRESAVNATGEPGEAHG